MLAHLLKYDTAQGRYDGHTVEAGEDSITVDGKVITIYKNANPAELPWGELGVDVVLECTGFFTSKDKGFRPPSGRREEGCHLRSRGQRPENDRFQR